MTLYTRRAVAADIEALLPLCRAFHAESPVHRAYAFDDDKVRRLLAATIEDLAWLAMIALDDDEIVGMLLLYCMEMFFSAATEVGDLTFWVRPDKRGGRAAMYLMKAALAWSIEKGASKIQLGITTGINEDQARRFYAKYGFEQTGILMVRAA